MAASTESAHQHRRRAVVKNGVWFKAIYIASVLVGKASSLLLCHLSADVRAENLFSCRQRQIGRDKAKRGLRFHVNKTSIMKFFSGWEKIFAHSQALIFY